MAELFADSEGRILIKPDDPPVSPVRLMEYSDDCLPVAEFSYSINNTDPCILSFHDESTSPFPCGIAAWEWRCGGASGALISTDQNPSHVNMEETCGGSGPWDVYLKVTDCCGCKDEVVMQVGCVDYSCPICTEGIMPPVVYVTISANTFRAPFCQQCDLLNGVHELSNLLGGGCTRSKTMEICGQRVNMVFSQSTVFKNPFGFVVQFDFGLALPNGDSLQWAKTFTQPFPVNCTGSHTLTWVGAVVRPFTTCSYNVPSPPVTISIP